MNSSAETPEVQELRRALDSLRVISELGRRITRSLKISDLVLVLSESLEALFSVDTFGLAFYSAKRKMLITPYNRTRGELRKGTSRLPVEGTLTGWALMNRTTLLILDVRKEVSLYLPPDRCALYLSNTPFLSAIYLPLFEGEELLGVLTVQSRQVAAYNEIHARFLESLGGFLTVALRNALNHRKIRRLNRDMRLQARTDQLTGLANRRSLSDFLEKTISYSKRNRKGFALLFFDLDGFKPVNDLYGHAAGDWVLVQLSQRLRQTLRDSDMVARVGGDEFIAVALEVDTRAKAELLAAKILSVIEAPLQWGGHDIVLGASIGIALYPDHGEDSDTLVTLADDAMYRIKHTGKHSFDWATQAPH